MPTYTFTLPYAASAETITIADEVSGAVVDTIAPAATSGALSTLVREGSEVVITANLDVGEYVATAVDTESWSSTRFSTEGVLDVPASLQALPGSYVPLGAAAVVTGQLSYRLFPKVQSDTGGKITAKPLGEGSAGLWDAVHDDSVGYLFHLQSGVNSTSATATIGIGLDKGAANGILISAKSTGRGIDATNNPSSTGDLARFQNWSTGLGLSYVARVGAGPMRISQSSGQGFGDGSGTLNSTTFTSATANFTGGDVGSAITQLTSRGEGTVIDSGTTIASVTNSTTVVLSKVALKTGTGVNFQIANRSAVSTQTVLEFLDVSSNQRLDLTATRLKILGGTVLQVENASSNARLTSIENARVGMYSTNGTAFKRHELYGQNYFWGSLRVYPSAASIGAESGPIDAFKFSTSGVGFNGTDPVAKPTITGSRGGNAALADLLTKIAATGLFVDGTSA